MSMFDITPPGAFMNAIQAANESHLRRVTRQCAQVEPAPTPRRLSRLAKALRSAHARAVKALAAPRPIQELDSRTV